METLVQAWSPGDCRTHRAFCEKALCVQSDAQAQPNGPCTHEVTDQKSWKHRAMSCKHSMMAHRLIFDWALWTTDAREMPSKMPPHCSPEQAYVSFPALCAHLGSQHLVCLACHGLLLITAHSVVASTPPGPTSCHCLLAASGARPGLSNPRPCIAAPPCACVSA